MKIEYDHEADAVYVPLKAKKEHVWKSREVEPGIILDLNKQREVIGIEILDVSKRFSKQAMFSFSVKNIGAMAHA